MSRRWEWSKRTGQLDPATEYVEIYRIIACLEFPWDFTQALSFALFRTYAVPSIGGLLARTGEFIQRTQRRYDDTSLLLDAILEHGFDSATGMQAIRRMNQMHGAYPISNDDLRYVLATFVVTPIRWLDRFGWRRLSEGERVASANYYRQLGRLMGIREIPETHQQFAELLDEYEAVRFAPDAGAREVADRTLSLMTTFNLNRWLPAALSLRISHDLMDEHLLRALGYPVRSSAERLTAQSLLRLRGRVVRLMPPRSSPVRVRDSRNVRSYPSGYDVGALGTFPGRDQGAVPRDQAGT